MFALLTMFAMILIAPFVLIGVVLMFVGLILKTVLRLITLPFALLGITMKGVAFLVLTVIGAVVVLPMVLTLGLAVGAAIIVAWGALHLLTSLFGKGEPQALRY